MNNNNMSVAVLVAVVALVLGFLAGNSTGRPMMEGGDYSHGMSMGHSMDSAMDAMSMSLEGKTGDEFDKAFLEEMVVHHQGAVVMARQVLATSQRPELITLANAIIEAQEKEIGMMKAWRSAWFR